MQVFPGGKGLNQSIAIARAGGEVMHCGLYSNEGEFLKELLEESGAGVSFLKKTGAANGHAIIQVDTNGENCILLYGGTNLMLGEKYIDDVLAGIKGQAIALFQNETSSIGYAMGKAKEKGLKVAINPAPMNEKVDAYPLESADYLFLNRDEGQKLSGAGEPEAVITALRDKYPGAQIILTLGDKGAWFAGKEETFFTQAVKVEKVVDTTAAGDTFVGYFLALCDKGFSNREAMQLAAKAAALCVSHKGAAVSIPEFQSL
jgi:ribokinase